MGTPDLWTGRRFRGCLGLAQDLDRDEPVANVRANGRVTLWHIGPQLGGASGGGCRATVEETLESMGTQAIEETNARQTITRLVAELGVARLLMLVAEVVDAESDRLLMGGDRQEAHRYRREFRIVQRAVQMLRT